MKLNPTMLCDFYKVGILTNTQKGQRLCIQLGLVEDQELMISKVR